MSNFDRYNEIEKVDAHMHYNTDRRALLVAAVDANFRYVTINSDIYFFPTLPQQKQNVLNQQQEFGHRLDFMCSFPAESFNEPGWVERSIETIKEAVKQGAVAVKVWKNLGMELRDSNGDLVMVDDERIAPIFQYIVDNNIPLTGHLGEPRNCWLPIEEMTVVQDKAYFKEHPEYHMYLQPEFPSYEEQIRRRDNILDRYPDLKFNGAHFASLEWNVDEVAKRLDKYPNMMVDTAERICHLQHQSIEDYDRVRNFVIKYQDRIMYGTDVIDDNSLGDQELIDHIKSIWNRHWKYFTTDEIQSAPKVFGKFKGLDLPWEVLEKIYFKNAIRFYSLQAINSTVSV